MLCLACFFDVFADNYSLNLEGLWSISTHFDKEHCVIAHNSFGEAKISLPGSMQSQGFGFNIDENTNWTAKIINTSWIKNSGPQKDGSFREVAFLQPKKHFIGKVYYQKTFIIPKEWLDKNIILFLERVHISTRVYLDGKVVGKQLNSLSVPHVHKLGKLNSGKHTIVIEVDNQLPAPVGLNACCVSDNAQTNWNGIIGEIKLRALPNRSINHIMVIPDVKNKKIAVKVYLDGEDNEQRRNIINITVLPPNSKKTSSIPIHKSIICDWKNVPECEINLGDELYVWDEYNPNIYFLSVEMIENGTKTQLVSTTFGMVDYSIKNQQFFVNGNVTLLRGTVNYAVFPKTAYPPMDVDYWRDIFLICKKFGLNHVRFNSWIPPESAFVAADRIGIYLQCEHAWGDISNEKLQNYIEDETQRVFSTFGNHPSFMIAAYGNQPSGLKKIPFWLYDWVQKARVLDFHRRIYISSAGWGTSENSDFYDVMQGMRVYSWNDGLNSSINKNIPASTSDFRKTTLTHPNKPYIAHETGQWCVYPDYNELKQYNGFLQAENFKVFFKNLKDNNLMPLCEKFFLASGRLQTLCYKNEIEKLRRTPGCGGYQILGLSDLPGYGTSPVGAVNAFWKTKSYTSSEEYCSFNDKCVILARFPKFIFNANETPSLEIDLSNYGITAIETAKLYWTIFDCKNEVCRTGSMFLNKIPLGLSVLTKNFYLDFTGLDSPGAYKLSLSLKEFTTIKKPSFDTVQNSWNFWIYPENNRQKIGDVLIVKTLRKALPLLAKGAKVLLIPDTDNIISPKAPAVSIGFSTIFRNTLWTGRQPPTTMGILCNPDHPVFRDFPTSFYSDYQWWYIINKTSKPLCLDSLPNEFQPLIYMIDDWFSARRLALMLECRVLKGQLLISAVDISEPIKVNLPVNQLRKSVLDYMNSYDFNPSKSLSEKQLEGLLVK